MKNSLKSFYGMCQSDKIVASAVMLSLACFEKDPKALRGRFAIVRLISEIVKKSGARLAESCRHFPVNGRNATM